ncbi:TVP38/TMEM64 family protein [Clostridium sp. A1-XYC3]|uniref:TVP38/TMEM64 family membrane protein n=1 Tax=Clostridium tanneri TaxID=3037988 RepID=A0ABU4JX62_9CLOT|nr:TVP38/TMEM64 family protein [Clostridium sp. A1-XYC3]MDW8802730.1 TVP38/TMEM64 family protein [Clostridium sp. A1-XYC3]
MDKKFWERVKDKLHEYKSHIVLGIIFAILLFIAYEYYHRYFYILKNPDRIKKTITSYGQYSILAFYILQIIQVIAFFIPGEVVQIAGGYIYGTLWGSILSLLGITTGSMVVYSISRFYGKPLINKIISAKDFKFFEKALRMGSVNYIVFLLYLIPGIPKDVLAYMCGISNITFKNFIIYSTLGRVPGIFMSAYFGAKFSAENKVVLIVIAIVAVVLFIVGLFKGEKIISGMVRTKSRGEE